MFYRTESSRPQHVNTFSIVYGADDAAKAVAHYMACAGFNSSPVQVEHYEANIAGSDSYTLNYGIDYKRAGFPEIRVRRCVACLHPANNCKEPGAKFAKYDTYPELADEWKRITGEELSMYSLLDRGFVTAADGSEIYLSTIAI